MKLVENFNENFSNKFINLNDARKFFALEDKFRNSNYQDLSCVLFFSKYYVEFGLVRHFARLLDEAVNSGKFITSLEEIKEGNLKQMFVNSLSCIFDTEEEINNYLSKKINITYNNDEYWL